MDIEQSGTQSNPSFGPSTQAAKNGIKQTISYALIALSLIWIISLILKDKESIQLIFSEFQKENFFYLIASTMIASVTIAAQLWIFEIIFTHNTHRKLDFAFLTNIFFTGQIIRYVPGRFLGIAYQINETHGTVSPLTVLKVNIEALIQTILFHAIAGISIIVFYTVAPAAGFATLACGVLLFSYFLHSTFINGLIQKIRPILPKRIFQTVNLSDQLKPYASRDIVKIVAIFIVSWIFYIWAWSLFPKIFVQLNQTNTILLCAAYNLSWIVGFVSMVTPGGLGVREVCFILITSKITTQSHLSFLALFVRLWLTFIDVLLFVISVILLRLRKRP